MLKKVSPLESWWFIIRNWCEVWPNLQKFLGIGQKIGIRTYIKRLTSPTSYFIHRDLMKNNKIITENLLNRKPSNLLAKFSIRGNAYEKIDCIASPQLVLRDVDFRDKHLRSLKIMWKIRMETCLISTVSLWKLSWKLIEYINVFIEHDAKCTAWTTLSELPSDNFPLSQTCEIQK